MATPVRAERDGCRGSGTAPSCFSILVAVLSAGALVVSHPTSVAGQSRVDRRPDSTSLGAAPVARPGSARSIEAGVRTDPWVGGQWAVTGRLASGPPGPFVSDDAARLLIGSRPLPAPAMVRWDIEPGVALAASALLPGAGQFALGNDRWVPYLALEVWGWLSFLDRRGDARALAADYRDLARFVARRVSVGERRDTIFEYYEAMTHFSASGTFDSDPELEGIQPEPDPRTFNGDQWSLARSLFFPGGSNYQPGSIPYARALDYYLEHAIPPTFTWAWGDSNLEQESFRELIRRSDEAYRSSTQLLGLILVNHLVSAVDALVIGRLQGGRTESRFRIDSRFDRATRRVPRLRIEASWRW